MQADMRTQLQQRIAQVRAQIDEAAKRTGREPRDILLCAASKTQDAQTVQAAAQLGITLFGENRVQEFVDKYEVQAYAPHPVHFIGHLQSNKVKYLVGKVALIHSVDSQKLLQTIDKEAAKAGIRQQVLIEINIGGEQSKSGVSPEQLDALLEQAGQYPHVWVRGLMSIPPKSPNFEKSPAYFSTLYKLFIDRKGKTYDNVTMDYLSMGMSGDFVAAIEAGANLVRVGTGLFGPRPPMVPIQAE